MPRSCAIHARPKSTASERRRSSAQPRRLERFRSRWTQGRGRSDRATRKTTSGAAGDQEAADDGVGGPAGLEHEGNGEDRCHIGDGDLGDHDHRLRAVEPSLLERRQDDGRRAGGEKDGVDGDMAGPRELGHDQATQRRGDRGHGRRQRAASEAAAQARVTQRDVHADGQHQHGEAGVGQERERRVVGVDDVQAAATEHDSRQDLADHDRHERAPAGREQRSGQTGGHDQREVAEAHGASLRARVRLPLGAEPARGAGDLGGSPPFGLMILGLLLALASALATNVAFLLKYRGAVVVAPIEVRHPLRSAAALFRSKWFAIGWLVAILAWVLHVGALAPRAAVDRPGRALRRAGLPGRPRRAVLRLSPRTMAMVRRHDHGRRAGGHRTDRRRRESAAALLAGRADRRRGRDLRDRRRAPGDLGPPPRPDAPRDSCSAWPPGRCSASPTSPSSTSRTPTAPLYGLLQPVDRDRARRGDDRLLRVGPQPPTRAGRRGHRLHLGRREPGRHHRRHPRLRRAASAPARSRSAPASSPSASSSPARRSCRPTTPSSAQPRPERRRRS